jgi:hypothetical protein
MIAVTAKEILTALIEGLYLGLSRFGLGMIGWAPTEEDNESK